MNRLWGQFFGIGIVEPVDNFHDENPPSHPELLDELAEAFVKANFDMNYLVKAICLTDAYQRSSARSHASQDNPRLFARMGVKALTGEQFYDSLALATGYREVSPGVRGKKGGVSPRSQFLTQFALRGSVSEPETSIQQALALMHGRFATEATTERTSMLLAAVAGLPRLQAAERIEILYLATLSRPPSPRELTTALDFVVEKGKAREREGLADVFWALLNSTEFRLNH